MKEKEESVMSPRFLARATGSVLMPFKEMSDTEEEIW